MLHINITPPTLEDGVKHIGTIIRIFEDDTQIGDDIVLTLENNNSLLQYTANIEPTNGKTYSATARYIFEPGGYQEESDKFILNVNDTDDTSILTSPPIMIPAPQITNDLGLIGLPNSNNIFNITIDTNETIGKYLVIIIDENKKVVDKFIISGNSNKINIDTILEFNHIYTLNIIAFTEVGISSPISSVTFTTGKLRDILFYFREDIGDYTKNIVEDLYLHLPDNVDSIKIEYIINNRIVNSWNINDSHIDLRNIVNNNINYKLRATAYYNNEIYGPIYFNHNINKDASLPSELPYKTI